MENIADTTRLEKGGGVEDVLQWVDDLSRERHKKYLLLESNYLSFVDELQDLLDPSSGLIRVRPDATNTMGGIVPASPVYQELDLRGSAETKTRGKASVVSNQELYSRSSNGISFSVAISGKQINAINKVFEIVLEKSSVRAEISSIVTVLKRTAQYNDTRREVIFFTANDGSVIETNLERVIDNISRNCKGLCTSKQFLGFFSTDANIRRVSLENLSYALDRKRVKFDPLTSKPIRKHSTNPK